MVVESGLRVLNNSYIPHARDAIVLSQCMCQSIVLHMDSYAELSRVVKMSHLFVVVAFDGNLFLFHFR